MLRRSKWLLIAALALVALTAASSGASAASFRISPGGAISSPSVGKLSFTGSGLTIACNVTLNGTLSNALLLKVAGTVFGAVTAVRIANCEGGNVSGVLNLNWPLKYNSILGTLPEAVTGILFDIERASFNLSTFFELVNCLYEGTAGALLSVSGRNPYTTGGIRALETVRLPLHEGEGCPATGSMRGSFTITAQTITRL